MEKFLHEIKLPEKDEFSRKFNIISDLFQKWKSLPEGSEKERYWDMYFESKLALEQGYPFPEFNL